MDMDTDSKDVIKDNGINIISVLTIVFVVLKLCGVVSWSWWWVLSPLWIWGIVLVIGITVMSIMFRN
jgi:fatty acid desaturase